MKRILTAFVMVLVLLAGVSFASNVTAPASNVCHKGVSWVVAPWASMTTSSTTNEHIVGATYSQGQYCVNTNVDRLYWAVYPGTTDATTNPPTQYGGDAADGTVVWRRVPSSRRETLIIINDSTNEVYLGLGTNAAVARRGIIIEPNGGGWEFESSFQGQVSAIAEDGTNNVLNVQGW